MARGSHHGAACADLAAGSAGSRPPADGGAAGLGWPGLLAVAATFSSFLLYAQFGFLTLAQERLAGPGEVRLVMAAMGAAGLAASFAAARLLRRRPARSLVRLGLGASAAAAPASLMALGVPGLAAAAAALGAATAVLTVALAAGLAELVPGRRRGLAVGAAVGCAYLACNVPVLFAAPPAAQALFVTAVCGGAWLSLRRAAGSPRSAVRTSAGGPRWRYRPWGFAAVTVSFLVLVWLDSAAFAVIQETPALKALTWGTAGQKLLQGGVHLAAAVVAGAALDAGLLVALLLGTFGLFAVAFALLPAGGAGGLAAVLYAVGISTYSVALVLYPSGRGDGAGLVPVRWRAAVVYGAGGWLGSALGVGMAQELHRIPGAFLAAAGGSLAAVWLAAGWRRLAPALRVYGPAALLGSAALLPWGTWLGAPPPVGPGGAEAARIARGRRVYIAEGCINCHSQYVRPGSVDEELWGPYREASAGKPPLIGNRRQGPDLLNVGARRSAAWQRLHLEAPRRLVPGSRMPSYAYLFTDPDGSGADLVAYLDSLGHGSRRQRYLETLEASVPATSGSPTRGRRLFGAYCAPCHGGEGRGDGPLAAAIYKPAMDLGKGPFWLVPWGEGAEPLEAALARVIRFGVPTTSMPGHEYLSERQVADLVAFVLRVSVNAPRLADAAREGSR